MQDLYWICRYMQCFAPQCNGRSSSIGTWFCKQLTVQSCLSPASLIYTHLNLWIQKCFYISFPLFPWIEWVLQENLLSIHWYRFVSRGWTLSNLCLCIPKTRSPLIKRRTQCTIGNARQMGAIHPTSEKPLGLLAKGSKNTPSPQPQPYLHIVKISTTNYPPSMILAL